MNQPDKPNDESAADEAPPRQTFRDIVGEFLERLSYTIGLGSVMFLVVAIPALFWPHELGRLFNGYTYTFVLVLAYFCVPFARRYMPRIK